LTTLTVTTASRPVRAIAFDWGGVFTEGTFDGSATRNLAELYGVERARVEAVYLPLMAEFERGAFDFAGFTRRFRECSSLPVEAASFRRTFLASVRERSAMLKVLEAIPANYRVAMLSNNVPELADRVREDARFKRIEHFLFSHEIGVRKPDPEAFAALTRALGQAPEETVFIDDNQDNIAACTALGFTGILCDGFESFQTRWREVLPDIPVSPV
jgi:putative hydrolase of the HAD superfamily